MSENWRDIDGYEGLYQASDLGRIKSLDRYVKKSNGTFMRLRGKILKLRPQKSGHLLVWLSKNGKIRPHCVHRLIAFAFLGPCPPGKECCHNNGICNDNRVSNLRWDTRANNIKQSYSDGRKIIVPGFKGTEHGSSVLTVDEVVQIRSSTLSCAKAAAKFGVSPMTISRCRRKITYHDVP